MSAATLSKRVQNRIVRARLGSDLMVPGSQWCPVVGNRILLRLQVDCFLLCGYCTEYLRCGVDNPTMPAKVVAPTRHQAGFPLFTEKAWHNILFTLSNLTVS